MAQYKFGHKSSAINQQQTTNTLRMTTPKPSAQPIRQLHIGGQQAAKGWEVFDALSRPEVDHVGEASALERFADATFQRIYAAHILEHFDHKDAMRPVLAEWHRVLKPGGDIYLSVPDMQILARMLCEAKEAALQQQLMMVIFGSHRDQFDFHYAGFTEELLVNLLTEIGFSEISRVDSFGLFNDSSEFAVNGEKISLNIKAKRGANTTTVTFQQWYAGQRSHILAKLPLHQWMSQTNLPRHCHWQIAPSSNQQANSLIQTANQHHIKPATKAPWIMINADQVAHHTHSSPLPEGSRYLIVGDEQSQLTESQNRSSYQKLEPSSVLGMDLPMPSYLADKKLNGNGVPFYRVLKKQLSQRVPHSLLIAHNAATAAQAHQLMEDYQGPSTTFLLEKTSNDLKRLKLIHQHQYIVSLGITLAKTDIYLDALYGGCIPLIERADSGKLSNCFPVLTVNNPLTIQPDQLKQLTIEQAATSYQQQVFSLGYWLR